MSYQKGLFHHVSAVIFSIILLIVFSFPAFSQGKYRTFSQDDLAMKKAKAGKIIASTVTFRFHNTTVDTVNSLHLKLNADVTSIPDSGGFTTFAITKKDVDITGRTVMPGDSVTLTFVSKKKALGTHVSVWYWDSSGVIKGSSNNGPLSALTDVGLPIEPNGGSVLDYLYKQVIERPAGLVIGLPTDSAAGAHWIRYMKADRKYFVHTGPDTCFDFTLKKHELQNPHVSKWDDHILGEVHALKLAILASDFGVTQPDTPANRLGDLLYVNSGDSLNGMTIRAIVHLVDSALTYCDHPFSKTLAQLDSVVSAINVAFGGPYVAVTFTPFKLAGTQDLSTVPFLHTNPSIPPVAIHSPTASIIDPVPQTFALYQNYPNPFNPTTTIQFDLPQLSVVTLKVYNILGQEVATLVNGQTMDEGQQQLQFDASQLASGLYYYRITAGGFVQTKKMMLLK